MKLSDLRAALRNTTGNPSAIVDLGNGVPLTVTLQKTALLAELGAAFDNARTAETGLTLTDGNVLVSATQASAPAPVAAATSDDEDDFDL